MTGGFRLARHLHTLYAGRDRAAAAKNLQAKLSTGITLEYSIHEQDPSDQQEKARLVLIMGFTGPKESWGAVIEHLMQAWDVEKHKQSLEVLVLDNRGCGGSEAPCGRYKTSEMAQDVLALMDVVGWQAAHIGGCSMGGMISLEVATQAPERVISLTLISTARGKYKNPPGAISGLAKGVLARSPSEMIEAFLPTMYPDEALARHMEDDPEKTMKEVVTKFMLDGVGKPNQPKRAPLHGVIGQALATQTHFVSNEQLAALNKTGIPICIMGGRLDRIIPICETELLRQHLSGDHVKTVIMDDAGHCVNEQYPDESTAEIIAVMDRGAVRAAALANAK